MLINIMRNYHDELAKRDPEFERDPNRCYYIMKVTYKGKRVTIAVPLRSNINKTFQTRAEEIISTAPSDKTRIGCIAGFHILKAIPINRANGVKNKAASRQDLQLAEHIANFKISEFTSKVNNYFKRLEQGEQIFGAINFDLALELLAHMTKEQTALSRHSHSQQALAKKYGVAPEVVDKLINKVEAPKTLSKPTQEAEEHKENTQKITTKKGNEKIQVTIEKSKG